MAKKVDLLIIDPQKDFCCPKGGSYEGTLYVKGAEKDMERLAAMIVRAKDKIDNIRVTLDSHRWVHIAHPIWWKGQDSKNPKIYTQITYADVIGNAPKWRAANPAFHKRSVEYVKALEDNKRYPLYIWPPHCIIGSEGHSIYPELYKALIEWESQFAVVDTVTKGSNYWTEHYSAVKADVPDPGDSSTLLNKSFIERLAEADLIAISGEALSHCVANTVRDIATEFGDANVSKFVLLEDASSPVETLEFLAQDFVKEMKAKGMQIARTTDVF